MPIRLRVTAAFVAAMATVLALVGWLLYARVASDLNASLDRSLRQRAQDLAALTAQPGSTLERVGGSHLVEGGDSYAELLDDRGRVLEATPELHQRSLITSGEFRRASHTTIFADRNPVDGLTDPSRLLATPVSSQGRQLVLVVGTSVRGNDEILLALRAELLVAGPIALAMAAFAGYALAGMALRPVEAMRRRAADISAETTGERLPVAVTGDELQHLGETLNEMLDRLEGALERQRSFVADAGHELRTPLALLRTELELAIRHGETADELREAVRSASDEAERLTQLAEDLLFVARADQGHLSLRVETLPASDLLQRVVTRFTWRAQDAGRELLVDARSDLLVTGDRLRLEQAVGNLIDNALRHGAGAVRLSANTAQGVLELHVIDEGPGFTEAFLARAFERFSRPDDARTRGGAGLGLAIVHAIARAHGGQARAANRAGGGADVWVALPANPNGSDAAREAAGVRRGKTDHDHDRR
jgi:two-component system OmpR family sensor kinase